MFIRRRMWKGCARSLKTAPEFGLGRTLPSHRFRQRNCYGKFGELGKNREEACNANRITRNRNLGAHYTGVSSGVLGFRKERRIASRDGRRSPPRPGLLVEQLR